jgi:taurine dioxygenase
MHPKEAGGAIESTHPVVRTHPETGRKLLFVNSGFTKRFEDMTAEESRPLLDYLFRHQRRPEFSCRFRWRKNSIAFWDNRSTLHCAIADFHGGTGRRSDVRRVMHRVTIDGDRPV